MTEVGERIKLLLHNKGITPYRLAKETGVSYTGVTKILNGSTKNPQVESLSAIADYFGVSLDYLHGNSLWAVIEFELIMQGKSLADLALRTGLRQSYIRGLDRVTPDESDYEEVEKIAQELNINPKSLITLLAQQEPPLYDGPVISAEEAFAKEEEGSEYRAEKLDRSKPGGLTTGEIAALEAINDPEVGLFFKDFLDAPEDRREEMIRIWHVIREAEKGRKPGDKQGKS